MQKKIVKPELSFSRPDHKTLQVRLAGHWTLGNNLPAPDEIRKEIEAGPRVEQVTFDTLDLKGWETCLLTFLVKVIDYCATVNIHVEKDGLPRGVQRLITLAHAVPEKKGARREASHISFVERLGEAAIAFWQACIEMSAFIGEAFVAFARMFTGKARFRRSDLLLTIQECGAQALPIVSLISVLVGLILAFIGAIQLRIFGAQIYVASLVGIGMVRALAAVMTGIIMAGQAHPSPRNSAQCR